ncbi:MAG: hypothetical protein HY508_02210 [Acidobacteria bacterium]|nr:hypothetical protein [Acidobacteriota bacterium]
MNFESTLPPLPEGSVRLLRALAAVGGLIILAGVLFAPERIWPSLLLVTYFLVCTALAGAFFVALQYVAGAGWSVALRRVPETLAMLLPAAGAALILVLLARPSLYPWAVHDSAYVALQGFKALWLNRPFFLARAAVYLALWIGLALAIVRTSRRQDSDGAIEHTLRNEKLSAVFIVVFALTFWPAAFDWIMSLEPHWSSTIFGVYNFAGMFLSGLATIIVLTVWLERLGPLHGVLNDNHLHDLGRLLFAFSTFWAYIWFSQYMLIWYANFPEETVYYTRRLHGAWQPLFLLNFFLNWVVPFFILLMRASKRSATTLMRVAVFVLVGRWLDLYLMIVPPHAGDWPPFGVWEVGPAVAAVALGLLASFHYLRQAPIIPVRDPLLAESLAQSDTPKPSRVSAGSSKDFFQAGVG